MSTYQDSQRPSWGRRRPGRLLAGGLVASGLVVGATGLVGVAGAAAAHHDRPSASENAYAAGDDSARDRGWERRAAPVPCDSAKLIAALVRVNAEGGGALRLAPRCTYTLTDAFHQPDAYDGGIRDAREAADAAENPGQAEKPPRNPADDKAGLPVIYHPVIIEGEHATIERRRDAEDFRFFTVRDAGELTLRNVTLVGGRSAAEGGAVHVVHGASAVIERVTALHNTSYSAEGGGGALFNDGNMVVRDSTLVDNHAYGREGKGGGLLNNGVLTLHSSTFEGNSAAAYGGGLGNYQAAAEVHTSTFERNSAAQGGGLASFSARTRVSETKVVGNRAQTGGGIANSDALIFLRDMEIRGNVASGDGGGVSSFQGLVPLDDSVVAGNTAHGSGGGVYAAKSNLLVRDSTVRHNAAVGARSHGGGVAVSMGRVALYRSLVAENRSTLPAGGLDVDKAQATVGPKTVVAENRPSNCMGSTSPVPNCFR